MDRKDGKGEVGGRMESGKRKAESGKRKMKRRSNTEKSFKFSVSREDNEDEASSSSVSFRI